MTTVHANAQSAGVIPARMFRQTFFLDRSCRTPLVLLAALALAALCPPKADAFEPEDCVLEKEVCADSADRVVNGQTVHRDCWRWERTYACRRDSPDKDRCRAGSIPAACSVTATTCSATEGDLCLEETAELLCTAPPEGPGISPKDPIVSVTTSTHADGALPDQKTQPENAPREALGLTGCRVTARSCLDDAPRTISVSNWPGHETMVSDVCWKEAVEISCPDAENAESCQKLEAAGCRPAGGDAGKVCEVEENGACLRWSAVYVCEGVPVEGDDIVVDGSTDVPDGGIIEDTSACDAMVKEQTEAGLVCEAVSSTCLRPGSSETVNGEEVVIDCALKEVAFRCRGEGRNGCAALEALTESGVCRVSKDPVCEAWDEAGACISSVANFICGGALDPSEPPGDAQFVETVEEIEAVPVNRCRDLESNASCALADEVCTEGPGIKMMNGRPVYKDCWMWSRTYVCAAGGEDECAAFADDPECELVGESCGGGDPVCARPNRVYRCTRPGSQTVVGEVCDGESCIAGVCVETDDPEGKDFVDAVIAGEIAREASIYGDISGNRFFSGEHQWCKDRMGASSCCRREVVATVGNDMLSTALAFGVGAGFEAVKFIGSPYVFDLLSSTQETQQILQWIYGSSLDGVYSPSMNFWGVTFSYSASGGLSIGFSPTGFMLSCAAHFYQNYASCDMMDQKNAMAKGQKLCTYVGNTCEKRVPGLGCVKSVEQYVCFNSILARIINEQGRPQVGRNFGTPESPDPQGFTLEEMNRLDFSKMDFSEFVESVVAASSNADEIDVAAAKARAEERLKAMLEGELGELSPVAGPTGRIPGSRPEESAPGGTPAGRRAKETLP